MMRLFKSVSKSKAATLAGIIAVIFWSSNVAVSKTVMNELGPFKGAFYIYFFSGILIFFILVFVLGWVKFLKNLKSLPLKYYLQTAIYFVFNNVFFFVAIGLTKNNEEILIVALLNYLWPIFIFIFRIPINRARIIPWLFFPAIILALSGIVIALFQGYTGEELITIAGALNDNTFAFLFAFLGAVSWAIYSNMLHKYKASDDIAVIPLILIFSSLIFFLILFFRGEVHELKLDSLYTYPYLAYTIIGPTCLGYLFWYIAMKQGNRNLITSSAYLIPLGSVFIVSIIHSFPVRPMFWVSAILLIIAAILGMKAVKD